MSALFRRAVYVKLEVSLFPEYWRNVCFNVVFRNSAGDPSKRSSTYFRGGIPCHSNNIIKNAQKIFDIINITQVPATVSTPIVLQQPFHLTVD